jgi:aspartate racemase
MRSQSLITRFRDRYGVELITPDDDDAAMIDSVIFNELVRQDLRPASKQAYLSSIARLRGAGAEGIILGCTEIFLLIDQLDLPGCPVFDTAALHVAAAVQFALKD